MKRLIILMMLALLALAGCGGGGSGGGSREFVWQRIDTQVAVRADGTLGVTETLTLRYTGGPFTFAFRDLPERRLDGITNVRVSDGDQAYGQTQDEESETPYTFSLDEEDGAQRVRWVYPATTGGERTFTLSYDVAGAVRRGTDADEVWWSVVFPNREELVEQATGTITLPTAVPANELSAAAPDVPGTLAVAPGQASVQAANIPPDEELTLRLRFPTGVVAGSAPAWQAADETQSQYDATLRPTVNVALSALSAVLAVLLAGLLWLWWRRNRDAQPMGMVDGMVGSPPDDLPPAVAAKLVGTGDNQAMMATLLDLANRGFLVFNERAGGMFGGSTKLAVARADRMPAELSPHERATLDAVLQNDEEALLDSSNKAVARALPKLGAEAQTELIQRGLLSEAGLARRRQGFIIGTVLLIVGLAALIPALVFAERYSFWLPVAACVLVAGGAAWLIVASAVRGLTEAGSSALARWRGFQRYLRQFTTETAPSGQFGALLPYSVAVGDPSRLTKSYARTAEPLPVWYYPVLLGNRGSSSGVGGSGFDGGASNSMLLGDFSQNFISALNGATSGVTGSSGGSTGGGGGASGGGGGGAG